MRIGILGGGESGVGSAILANSKGHIVLVSDSNKIAVKYKNELNEHNIQFEESGHTFEILETLDLIVKSPGIPNTAKIIKHLKKKGVRIIGEIEFGFLQCSGKIIAITGTNGKTTTTNLTYEMLRNEYQKVGKGGNLGNSFCRMILDEDYDWFVLEVSSFQLDDIVTFKPDIACILNVTPDHLDRYEHSIKKYRKAKFRIAMNQSKEDILFIAHDVEIKKTIQIANVRTKVIKEEKVLLTNPYLRGKHNAMNVTFAKMMSKSAGVSDKNIEKALESFVNDNHRLQPIVRIDEVMYVNDSKATNVDAVYYALTAFSEPIIWIMGGIDKGNDYSIIEKKVKKNVKAIIILSEDTEKIKKFFKGKVSKIIKANNMNKAVKKATMMATSGDVVLLSPACASFDRFDNYKDRGEQFINEVWNLLENRGS